MSIAAVTSSSDRKLPLSAYRPFESAKAAEETEPSFLQNIEAFSGGYIARYSFSDLGNVLSIEITHPFKLHELLEDGGNLGIIISNSWLGTNIGKKFYKALQHYYHIKSVVMSNCNRWFKNADVVN